MMMTMMMMFMTEVMIGLVIFKDVNNQAGVGDNGRRDDGFENNADTSDQWVTSRLIKGIEHFVRHTARRSCVMGYKNCME